MTAMKAALLVFTGHMMSRRNWSMMRFMTLCTIITITAYGLSCGPSRQKQKSQVKTSEPPSIEKAISLDLVPLADGGLYAVDTLEGVVWYISDGKARRVSGIKADVVDAIVPVAEGGAYIKTITDTPNGGLYYLNKETATKVQEHPTQTNSSVSPKSREGWLWSMWQRERHRRESSEERAKEDGPS
jgi:hypothetical protein